MDTLGPYRLGPDDTESWGVVTGDARELSEAVPDESVDLIFTDPVYQNIKDYEWLGKMSARVLRPGGQLIFYQAHVYYPITFEALCGSGLDFRWLGTEFKIGTQTTIWGRRVLGRTRHVFFYSKPPAVFTKWLIDHYAKQPKGKGNHDWSKHGSVLHWIEQLDSSPIILDPFTGGGTVPAVAKMLSRRWLAFEIDPDTANLARQRVAATQPALPSLTINQLDLIPQAEAAP